MFNKPDQGSWFRHTAWLLPLLMAIVIFTNVWYHGPKAWIFVTLGNLVALGVFIHLGIRAERDKKKMKSEHEKFVKELGGALEKTVSEMTYEKSRSISYWQMWSSSEIRMVELLGVISRSCSGLIRYEFDPTHKSTNVPLNFVSDLMAPVVYLFVPTESGVKQIRWLLHNNEMELFDFGIPFSGAETHKKDVDVTQTQLEAFANIKEFLLAPLLKKVDHEQTSFA